MIIWNAIQKELERRDWTVYRLAQEIGGQIPKRTVYNYLSGKSDLASDKASIILEALGLEIRPKTRRKRKEV